jgi:hypothetical protein
MDVSWKEVSGKKRNRNGPEMSMSCKQSKVNRYQPSKSISTANSFNGLQERFDDANTIRMGKKVKHPPIFIVKLL